jgi:hypothetical protein
MPPGNYFGGAPNAFAGGQEFAAAQRRRRQEENALASLIQRFGPEAADPASLAALQGIQQRGELFPHQMGEAERATAAQEALVAQHGALAGDPQAVSTDAAMSTRMRGTMLNAARYLRATRERQGDTGEAFGRVVPLLSAIGMPAEVVESTREQILTDPDSLDALIAMLSRESEGSARALGAPIPVYDAQGRPRLMQYLSDGSTRIIEDVSPVSAVQGEERLRQGQSRIGIQGRRLSLDEAKARGFDAPEGYEMWEVENEDGSTRYVMDAIPGGPAEMERETTTREQESTDRKFLQSYGSVSDHADVVVRNADRALSFFRDADAGILLQSLRSGARRVPGTRSHAAWDALQAIKNNIGIDELQRMRQSSPTGGAMGNVSDRDISLLTGALGRLEVENNPERLVEDINFITSAYQRILTAAQRDAEAAQRRMREREQRGRYGPAVPPRSRRDEPEEEDIDDLIRRYAP